MHLDLKRFQDTIVMLDGMSESEVAELGDQLADGRS